MRIGRTSSIEDCSPASLLINLLKIIIASKMMKRKLEHLSDLEISQLSNFVDDMMAFYLVFRPRKKHIVSLLYHHFAGKHLLR